jgi:hypothetical protein
MSWSNFSHDPEALGAAYVSGKPRPDVLIQGGFGAGKRGKRLYVIGLVLREAALGVGQLDDGLTL